MKQFVTTLFVGACAALTCGAVRTAQVQVPLTLDSSREVQMKPTKLTQDKVQLWHAPERTTLTRLQLNTAPGAKRAAQARVDADINGQDYVVLFSDGYDDMNGSMTVAVSGTAIVFEGLASGYNVEGTWDAATGVATIPTGVVIGNHSSYGDITLLPIVDGAIGEGDITVTFADGEATFSAGICGQVTAGNLIVMMSPVAKKANGSLSVTQNTSVYNVPLLVKKTNNDEVKVIGISSLLYGYYAPVDLMIDKDANTLTLPFGTMVDNQYTSSGYVAWTLAGMTDEGLTDLVLDVTVENGVSTMTNSKVGYVYQNPTGTYSGYQFTDAVFTADFDVMADLPEPAVPCPIVGNDYVVFFNDGYDDLNEGTSVTQDVDGNVVFKELAQGYDLKGAYDATQGTVVIPTGIVIGNHSTYGNITLYAINEAGELTDEPINVTIQGDSLLFDKGIAGQVTAGTLIVIEQASAVKANASLSLAQNGNTFKAPLIVTKNTDTELLVCGISNLLYGGYYNVPFALDTDAKTATLTFGTQVDNQYTSSGYVPWYLGGIDGSSVTDLTLNIATTDDTSTLTADAAFYGYPKDGQYSGYSFTNVEVSVGYNVITAEATGEPVVTDTPTVDGIIYKVDFDANTAMVIGCNPTFTDLDVPATFGYNEATYTVVGVAAEAFKANKTVQSVTLPATVTTVETDAFRNMSALKAVNINDLEAWCAIDFANGNANPIYNLFSGAESKWGSVNVNGQAVTTLTVPEGVTALGRSFYGFKALTDVTLPSTLVTLGDQCFTNCIRLTKVEIPEGVTTVGSSFFGCIGLTEVTLPSTLTALNSSTFYGCTALSAIELPESLESIGVMTFSGCTALTEVELPAALQSIGAMAFDGCTGLTAITCHATVPPVAGSSAFDGVDKTIPLNVPEASVDAYNAADQWSEFTNTMAIVALGRIDAEAGQAVYFNLNGMRVHGTPASGLYIRVQNGKAVKVMVK